MSRAAPKQIAELNTLSIPRLEARWRTLFGTESPVRRQGRGSGQGGRESGDGADSAERRGRRHAAAGQARPATRPGSWGSTTSARPTS